MKPFALKFILLTFLFLLVAPSFAQEAAISPNTSTTSPSAGRRGGIQRIQERKQEIGERIAQKRQQATEAAQARREALKTKLAQIRNEHKKVIVERVDARLDQTNTRRTNQMAEFLARLEKILEKIEQRTNKAKENGKDVAKVESAIAEARAKVEIAKQAVEAQAGKTYTPVITDEAGLKNVVGKATNSLESDLRATRKTVIEAKQAIQKIMSILREVRGVNDVD